MWQSDRWARYFLARNVKSPYSPGHAETPRGYDFRGYDFIWENLSFIRTPGQGGLGLPRRPTFRWPCRLWSRRSQSAGYWVVCTYLFLRSSIGIPLKVFWLGAALVLGGGEFHYCAGSRKYRPRYGFVSHDLEPRPISDSWCDLVTGRAAWRRDDADRRFSAIGRANRVGHGCPGIRSANKLGSSRRGTDWLISLFYARLFNLSWR